MGNSSSVDLRIKGGYDGDNRLASPEPPGLSTSPINHSLGLKEVYAPANAHAE
jgi:hypothetical protein